VAWIAAWGLVPWLNAGGNLLLGTKHTSAVWEQSDVLIVLNYVAISFAIVVSLLGTERIVRRLGELGKTRQAGFDSEHRSHFRGLGSTLGPLAVSGVAAAVFAVSTLLADGWVAGALRGATWFVIGIALFTYLWTYGCLLLGLNRVGSERLVPDPLHVDPGLGLQPLGSIASTGLWMLLVWLVPVLVTALPDVVGAIIGLLVLAAVLAALFLSLLRLHWQMLEIKASELEIARELYAQAYAPVHEARTLDALEHRRGLLAAADNLEKRASAIHEWPFAERTPTLVLTVATSVVAMTIGRLILDPFGL
jgi:hypothetical protein